MKVHTFDLRHNFFWEIEVDKGVIYTPTISGITNIDPDGYTLELVNEDGVSIVIPVIVNNNVLSFILDTTTLGLGSHRGVIQSISNVSGIYFRLKIKIIVYETE